MYAWDHVGEIDTPTHLGDFEYVTFPTHEDHSNKLLQSFELKHSVLTNKQRLNGIKVITVYIKNNGGDDTLTCLYRLKVFGTPVVAGTSSTTSSK